MGSKFAKKEADCLQRRRDPSGHDEADQRAGRGCFHMKKGSLPHAGQLTDTKPDSGAQRHTDKSTAVEDRICAAYGYSKDAFRSEWASPTRPRPPCPR